MLRTFAAFTVGIIAALVLLVMSYEVMFASGAGETGGLGILIVLTASTLAGLIVAAFERGPEKRFVRTAAAGLVVANASAVVAAYAFLASIRL